MENFNFYKEFASYINYAINNFKVKFNNILEHNLDKNKNILLKDYQIFTASIFLLEQIKSLMIFWETGFGKTIECLYIIQNIFKIFPKWKIFIIVKSSLKIDPWENNIKEYLNENIRSNIYMFHYNLFDQLEKFRSKLYSIRNERILFIFDESHDFIKKIIPKDNLFEKERRLNKIFHEIINIIYKNPFNKVLFMTATPINDSILEFNYNMFILRNGNLKLNEDIFNDNKNFIAPQLLERISIGLISYQKRSKSDIFKNIEYKNNLAGKKIFFENLLMSNFQSNIYKIISNIEIKNKSRGFRILRRITNMFVFNDPKFKNNIDNKVYENYLKEKYNQLEKILNKINFSEQFINCIKNEDLKIYDNTSLAQNLNIKIHPEINYDSKINFKNNYDEDLENLNILNSMSSKYIKTCQIILQSIGKCAIYQPFTKFEGVKTLILYFKKFNISYIEYTGNTKNERDSLVSLYNSKDNIYGEKIKVCIFSSAGIEGISFLNIKTLIIMDIPWSGSELEQIFGRCIRLNSHNDLPENERYVNIHILINHTNNNEYISIDEDMLNVIIRKEEYKKKIISFFEKISIENIHKLYPNIEPIEKENIFQLINYKYDLKNFKNNNYSILKKLIKIKFTFNEEYNNIEIGYLDDNTNDVYQDTQIIGKLYLINGKKQFKVINNEIVYLISAI